jgi:hypothetical protein
LLIGLFDFQGLRVLEHPSNPVQKSRGASELFQKYDAVAVYSLLLW